MTLKTFLLSENAREKIKYAWPQLSSTAQSLILGIVTEGQKYEQQAIKVAAKNDPNFLESFKHRLAKAQSDSLKRIEAKENDDGDERLLKDLAKL